MNDHSGTELRTGTRVRYVGFGVLDLDGPTGRVSRLVKGGVRVKWDSGASEVVHNDHVLAIGVTGLRP